MNSKLTRRGFVTAAGAAIVAPTIVPSSVFGVNAPSNRINVALIGCGNQSRGDLPSMLRQADAQVVAVCDVNRGSGGYAWAVKNLVLRGLLACARFVPFQWEASLGDESHGGSV